MGRTVRPDEQGRGGAFEEVSSGTGTAGTFLTNLGSLSLYTFLVS